MNPFRIAVHRYVTFRRMMGFQFTHVQKPLEDFADFLKKEGSDRLTTALSVKWAKLPQNTLHSYWATRLGMVREFAHYYRAFEPKTEVPPPDLMPYRYRRRNPHIYSDKDIERLLLAADTLRPRRGVRKHTYFAFLGLIAVAGFRLNELILLDIEDVNFDQSVLRIRRTKFGKSRLVPVHPTVLTQLRRYGRIRDRLRPRGGRQSRAFFISDSGDRLTKSSVRWAFVRMSKKAGLRGPQDRRGPRIHDLRHTFAVKVMISWYRQGLNVDERMPLLSTYLGHVHPTNTYWYLSSVPELLGLAGARLEKQMGGKS